MKKLIHKNRIKFIIYILSGLAILFFILEDKDIKIFMNTNNFPRNETLTISLSDVQQIPWATADTYTFELETFGAAVFGSLVELNETGMKRSTQNDILLKEYVCDRNICHLELKKGIYFHNSREVNAYDLEFSLVRELFSYENDSFAYSMLKDIDGIEEFFKQKAEIKNYKEFEKIKYPTGYIKGIEVIDKYNIKFYLKNYNNYIVQTLSTAFLPIVPIEELKEDGLEWKNLPIGFGRYKIISSDLKKYQFMLERVNSNDDICKYIRIVFGQHKDIDIRIATQDIPYNKEHEDIFKLPGVYGNGGFLFNYKTRLGQNENFRKAIHYALDRKKIAQSSLFNEITPENQLIPNYGLFVFYRADVPISEQNMQKALYHLSLVPKELWQNKVFTVHSFWTANKHLAKTPYFIEMKNQLKQIGLNIEFVDTDMAYTKFKENDENVLWWTGFDLQTHQPNSNFSYFHEGSFFNNIYPDDPEFRRLYSLTEQETFSNPKPTQRLSQYFTENNIMVVVFNLRNTFLYNKNRIQTFGEQKSSVKLQLTELRLNENNLL
ncbi:ABC transporter substrate-binding protein [Fluviispira vulneris]|uniref:ABC transporter substrate-binding protein n=1 Tax=Fluviispira vulneris TaxID=2763012 RepID=UPI001645E583|nr:ABC transporter substrate-binding protein [Fluviispira vulneris]